jgi:glycosyltransferase involved in cell wall biosynthesis
MGQEDLNSMNVLFLAPQLPYPGVSGGTLNSRKLLDFFCSKHTVTLVSLIKENEKASIEAFNNEYRNKINKTFFFNIDKPRSAVTFLLSLFAGLPLSIYRNYDRKIKSQIIGIIAENNFDLVFCDYLIMTQYVPLSVCARTVFNDNNAEYMIWKRFANIEKNIIKRWAAAFEAYRLFRYETAQCKKVSLVIAAQEDINHLKPYAKDANFAGINHLGNDVLLNEPDLINKETHRLLFISTLTWEANRQGIRWFVEDIYPIIKENLPDASLYIVGSYNKPFLRNNNDASIHVLGFVPDLRELYRDAEIFICPLKFGSGTKIKLLDALYRGLPIVTTSIGAESIALVDGENCFVADTEQDFARKTVTLLKDKALWEQFSNNSRILAAKQYTWEDEYGRMERLLRSYFI